VGGAADGYADPMMADNLLGVAPMYAVAAAFDPLRDDARVFAEPLRGDGVESDAWLAPGLAHGFLRVRHTSATAADAFRRVRPGISQFLAT
jgi:acetyl esterase